MNDFFSALVDDIIDKEYSLVEKFGFSSIYNEKDRVNATQGDIVECGVWKGGMCVFLTKLFPTKKIWVVDSFLGFEKVESSTYPTQFWDKYNLKDPHIFEYPIRNSALSASLEDVKSVFEEYGELNNPNVNFLQGYVKNTLKEETCPIKEISLLRIDVDSYSATMDVLNFLYPKVVSGGIVIFDDGNIDSARFAIADYFKENEIKIVTMSPITKIVDENIGACHYIIKK